MMYCSYQDCFVQINMEGFCKKHIYYKNREKNIQRSAKNYYKKREYYQKYARDYQKNNRLKIMEKRKDNVKFKEYQKLYKKNKRLDTNFRIIENMRNRLRHAIKFGKKNSKTLDYIGCSLAELRIYIQNKFLEGMSWNNYGRGIGKWNMDHIIPCDNYNLTKDNEIHKCFHYTNLQPLWHIKNCSKNNK